MGNKLAIQLIRLKNAQQAVKKQTGVFFAG